MYSNKLLKSVKLILHIIGASAEVKKEKDYPRRYPKIWPPRGKFELQMQTVCMQSGTSPATSPSLKSTTLQTTKPSRDQGFFCRSMKAQNMQDVNYWRTL